MKFNKGGVIDQRPITEREIDAYAKMWGWPRAKFVGAWVSGNSIRLRGEIDFLTITIGFTQGDEGT